MKFESWEKTEAMQAELKARKDERLALLQTRSQLLGSIAELETKRRDLAARLVTVNTALGYAKARKGIPAQTDLGIWDGDDYVTTDGTRVKNARTPK